MLLNRSQYKIPSSGIYQIPLKPAKFFLNNDFRHPSFVCLGLRLKLHRTKFVVKCRFCVTPENIFTDI